MKKILNTYINSFQGLSSAAWLLALVMLINRIGSMVIPFLGLYMTQVLHFKIDEIGIVLMFYGIGSVCGSYFGGWLTDRFGSFKVQFGSLICAAPLFLLIPLFTTVVSLSIMIFVLSLIFDTFRPANSVSITQNAKPENITRAFSLNRLAVNLGFSIGPAAAGFLSTISFHLIFYANSIAVFVAAIVFFYFFRNRKPRNLTEKISDDNLLKDKIEYRNPYKDLPFIAFNISCCVFAGCFFQLITTLPLFYKQVYLLNDYEIGFLLGWSGFVIVLFEMFVVHYAESHFTIRKSLLIGILFCALSYLMLNYKSHVSWLYFSFFILSIGEMLTLPFMATATVARSSIKNQGAYMGFNSLAFAAANIFSPLLGTKMISHYGFNALWYVTSFGILLAGAGFYFSMKKMKIN